MSDFMRDLYQEMILDHNRSPRNFGALEEANRQAEGFNPLCGDQVTVFLLVKAGRIEDIRFDGVGCAISTAAASIMTQELKGLTENEAEALFGTYNQLIRGEGDFDMDELGRLAVFGGVSEYPARVKCASLCWHTAKAALQDSDKAVTTE